MMKTIFRNRDLREQNQDMPGAETMAVCHVVTAAARTDIREWVMNVLTISSWRCCSLYSSSTC